MDDEAAILLARTHATLVRQLSEVAGHHFEGLQAAARYKSLNLTNRQRRQLCHLDIAFNWSRHVTSVKCATLTAEILKHVSPVPAATCAATAACAPVQEQNVESIKEGPQERVQQRTDEQIVPVPVPTVQEQICVPVKSGAQVMERIQEHIVESFDQEELDQLRHDWLMGAFEHPDF